ncbi:energy-coupling factor transporter transmembrane protein EcfT [Halobacillus shinanisalinarum]|uniref:Energy-coupling factor transporter transmembrane protein EcfT n=1 Tax=Halobacillus shinanisalinarum TaxID=2932258 RepID=A0ABY4H474_9BACI|nr:energy-coupling factor transporter transmembrane component T [Halobacillus shinanisalinarum]UOQ95263.1 energy-coupling factor transporter transmembrane protein EcfT [Halobacillus shinanisalinarum]
MLLHRLNPSIKALTVIAAVIGLALIFDPITPLLFSILTVACTFIFGKVKVKYYLMFLIPFTIISFGMLWTTIVFADAPDHPNQIVHLLLWEVPKEDVIVALSLALRMFAFATLSLMFIFTTDMVGFILSLMQQCKLSPKLAYGVLAGYRFLPLMKEEFQHIQEAHQVRGVKRGKTVKESFKQYKRFVIPLLAGAIRKAERTAVAMESKGFTGSRERSFYRVFTVKGVDWIFFIITLASLIVIAYISYLLGYFRWYQGQF